jgi:NAD-dependent dihydropyrimidine dehydrogenase PreA subunit
LIQVKRQQEQQTALLQAAQDTTSALQQKLHAQNNELEAIRTKVAVLEEELELEQIHSAHELACIKEMLNVQGTKSASIKWKACPACSHPSPRCPRASLRAAKDTCALRCHHNQARICAGKHGGRTAT